jgi:hypothetical protein
MLKDHDAKWLAKNFAKLQTTNFQCNKELDYACLYFLLALGPDPYLSLDRAHANFHFQMLRILLKLCQNGETLTAFESRIAW